MSASVVSNLRKATSDFLKSTLKYSLTVLGARSSPDRVRKISALGDFVAVGQWMKEHGFHAVHRQWHREAVWADVARRVADKRVLYLEFGVYQGDSIRYWSRALTHPQTVLHGFDSFEGLPEAGGRWRRGQFDMKGVIPEIHDDRVKFFKGWFDEVLPAYVPPEHDVLVINLDADLYSSTICALRALRNHIRPGTFIYFDELEHREHEARAFDEFMAESGHVFLLVSAHVSLAHVFFECIS
jgi:hypothetical protein